MLEKKDNENNEQEKDLNKDHNKQTESAEITGEQPAAGSPDNSAGPEAGSPKEGAGDAAAPGEPAAEEPVSAEAALTQELAALNEKHLRLFAEFDNFKRRSAKERRDLVNTASKNVIVALLPVLDDFDRAQKSMESAADVQAVKEGIDLIIAKFKSVLSQQGLKEMEATGTPFDADLHEAVSNIPAPSEDMKGKVIDQLEKGYYLNDKVIRYAKVFVGA